MAKELLKILLSFCFIFPVLAQWEQEHDDGIVKVWTADTDYSEFKKFKAQVEINASIATIIEFMKDINKMPNWYHNTIFAKLLPSKNPKHTLVYSVTNLPWPVSDRDAVMLATYKIKRNKTVIIRLNSRADAYLLQADNIRVPSAHGYWRITPRTANKTHIEFGLSAQPGGYIPSWLANAFIIDMPLNTLTNLKQQVEAL